MRSSHSAGIRVQGEMLTWMSVFDNSCPAWSSSRWAREQDWLVMHAPNKSGAVSKGTSSDSMRNQTLCGWWRLGARGTLRGASVRPLGLAQIDPVNIEDVTASIETVAGWRG